MLHHCSPSSRKRSQSAQLLYATNCAFYSGSIRESGHSELGGEKEEEEACHGLGRYIERSPLRRGAIDCVGDSNEMNGEYNQS